LRTSASTWKAGGKYSQLREGFRKERAALTALLDPASDAESPLGPGLEVLQRRSERLAPVAAELRSLEQAGRLTTPVSDLAGSYLHMHANRLLRSSKRAQEMVLYDFLARPYESRLAARSAAGTQTRAG
jgi:thiopeptide-type bacteriocin biosynthesis protein